jgi:YD repeat-containing protein
VLLVQAQIPSRQYASWSAVTNGTNLGNGTLRKTSTGVWDFSASATQTLLAGDGYFESTAANYNQSITLNGVDGATRALIIGTGGWAGIYENGVEVAGTYGHAPGQTFSAHVAGDRYRLEIVNGSLRYIRYRSVTREILYTSSAALPVYPYSLSLGMAPQNAEWRQSVMAQLNRRSTWASIANGIDLGNGSVRKTSTGVWDFSAGSAQTLLRGDGYFESTASDFNQAITVGGSDGLWAQIVVGTGGWAAIYENGVEVAGTSGHAPAATIAPHAAGDRYRLEIINNKLRYVRFRAGVRTGMYLSTSALPAYPLGFIVGASFQNSEWQNSVFAQITQNATWAYITNGIDLGNGSLRKTSTGTWDFGAGAQQQLVSGSGYFESTASYFNQSISVSGSDAGYALIIGTGGWAGIYENNVEVAGTYGHDPAHTFSAHAAGDRYRLEIKAGKLKWVRYRGGLRTLLFTSSTLPAYPLSFGLGASFQNSEWQNSVFSDYIPEHNDAIFISQTVPATMTPGQNYSVSVTMHNTGASTWTPEGDYQLGAENLTDNSTWGASRVNLATTVPPGSDGTFNFTVTAPTTPGAYNFQWRMVQNGVQRFGPLTTNVSVQTVNNPPTVSLTNPANDANFNSGSTVTLNANASDSDGTISKVEFFQGSIKLGEDTTAPYSYAWTNVAAGNYVLTARATDNGGAIATSGAVNITVTTPNQPPVANTGGPYNGLRGQSIQFNSGGSSDPDGLISSYQWSFGDGQNGSGATPTHTYTTLGTKTVTLIVTDNAGATNSATTTVTITNQTPVANPGGPYSGYRGLAIQFGGSSSSDPDGTISTYQWSFDDGGNGTGATVNHTFTALGTHTATLTVADNDGATNGANATITVANQPPVANAGGSYNGFRGLPIQFNGSGSSDPDGTISTYQWNFDDGGAASGATASHAFTALGTHSAQLTVTDNNGTANSATVNVTVANQSPLASAGGPYTGFTGVAVQFNGDGSSDPDGSISTYAWSFGDTTNGSGVTPTHTYTTVGTYPATLTVTDNNGATHSATANVTITGFNNARLDPLNRIGGSSEDPLSRNFNWSIPLVSLPGRAGLDFGLSLSYNSLATWTKSGSSISFNDDGGFPAPGFRLGFPVIQSAYYNTQASSNSFLLIMPSGARVELRQIGASTRYQAVDSSYLLLDSNTMILRTTDGTQLSYAWKGDAYKCTKIKDRNGNFISINYDPSTNRLISVVDTLNRTITFNYDGSDLASIAQSWYGQTHYWARFAYANKTIQTNFSGLTVYGPANNTTIRALMQVKLADDSHYDFDYTSWGQVWKISQYTNETSAHLLNYVSYNLPADATNPQSDCPRFTQRHDWAENWNLDSNGNAQEVTTYFDAPIDTSLPDNSLQTVSMAKVRAPDGTYQKIYFAGSVNGGAGSAPAWQRGLPLRTDMYEANNATAQRSATSSWTQDNESVPYQLNPRMTETNISDPWGNHARSRIEYIAFNLSDGTTVRLPENIMEYRADATTGLRRTHTSYRTDPNNSALLDPAYANLRIIGLVSEKTLYEVDPNTGAETLMSKTSYAYDELDSIQGTDEPVQHDNTNYSANFTIGRANVSSVTRHNVVSTSQSTTSTVKYNTAGAVVETTDPLSHTLTISYEDQFSANGEDLDDSFRFSTLGYPTTVTDPDGFTSTVRYNYAFGGPTWKQSPLPNVTDNQPGPVQITEYDTIGRFKKIRSAFNNAYTRYEYHPTYIETFATVNTVTDEAHSMQYFDGAGRVIGKVTNHPGSIGGYSGQQVFYDVMGRVVKQSNPSETSASGSNPYSWTATGDDDPTNEGSGWVYSQQTYDWKGRPRVTTNPDNTSKTASYDGCGCAGGEVDTLTDEVGRRQKVYSDVLGRPRKTEVLNWDDTVYSTTTTTYNARNQVTLVRQYAGSDQSTTYQDTWITYDGYGRLKAKHVPEQDAGTATVYTYNADDTIDSVTDARGVLTTLGYNARHLLTSITYPGPQSLPSGVLPTSNVTFGYDASGNRISMTDGLGSKSYAYDSVSRLISETRTFNDPDNPQINGDKTISYGYNLAGELKTITDPFGATVNYGLDAIGRVSNITGSGYGSVSQFASSMQYRAWGTLKSETYGNGFIESANYNRRMSMTSFEVKNPTSELEMSTSTQFYDDGQAKFSHNALDERFDRAYAFDQAGRISEAYSGSEARDFVNGTQSGSPTGPFRNTYQLNTFDQITQEDARLWSNTDATTSTFTNNRRQGWSYDADGRIKADDATTYTRDAAGRIVSGAGEHSSRASKFDGDGRLMWTSLEMRFRFHPIVEVNYYLTSTISGLAVAEMDSSGQRTKGYIYSNGRKVAEYAGGNMSWSHTDPVTGGRGDSTLSGGYVKKAEFNSDGVDVGFVNPITYQESQVPEPGQGLLLSLGSECSITDPTCQTCYLDGLEQDRCSNINFEASEQCQDNDCGPRSIWDPNSLQFVGVLPLEHDPNTGLWMVSGNVDEYQRVPITVRDEEGVLSSSPGTFKKIGTRYFGYLMFQDPLQAKIDDLVGRVRRQGTSRVMQIIDIYNNSTLDDRIIECQAAQESNFTTDGRHENSGVPDDLGLLQIQAPTAQQQIDRYAPERHFTVTEQSLFQPETNVVAATFYLRHLYERFGSARTALGAYKQGETNTSYGQRHYGQPVTTIPKNRRPYVVDPSGLSENSQSYADGILGCARALGYGGQ